MAMLFLILMPKVLMEKKTSTYLYFILALFYGAVLSSMSLSALLSLFMGTLFLMIIIRPSSKTLARLGALFLVISIVYYNIGLYDKVLYKVCISSDTYNTYQQKQKKFKGWKGVFKRGEKMSEAWERFGEIPPILEEAPPPKNPSWEILSKPYYPVSDRGFSHLPQYTTITARVIYASELAKYITNSATFKDILFGDFSLKNYVEYDSVYFYFLRNDGLIVTILFIVLFTRGFLVSLKKYRIFLHCGNNNMAALSLGIATFLLTSLVIQFNLSYFLTIYPLNFFTYFFLLLAFFINPRESETGLVTQEENAPIGGANSDEQGHRV
jgi:hypothetical protein